MEELQGIHIDTLPLKDLIKVSDLIYFDGPLLTHYQTSNKDNYLFYWVDVDAAFNRWLVLRVSLDKLQAFIHKKIPLYSIITNPEDNFVYKVDITADTQYQNVLLLYPKNIPENYLPSKDSYYTLETKQDLDLSMYSERYQSGILQAYYNNSSKVGYNEISLEVIGPSFNHLNELTIKLGKTFLKYKIDNAPKDNKNKPIINREAILNAPKLNFFGTAGGSFSALFKPYVTQIGMRGVKTEQDEFIAYVLNFITLSEDYTLLSKEVETIDKGIISTYKSLLQNIIASKLHFHLKWENSISKVTEVKELNFREAIKILDNLEKLEYDDKAEVMMFGRFTMVNLLSGNYEFHNIENQDEASKGKFDKIRMESAWQIKFASYYEVVIERRQTKQAGKKDPRINDILISFIEIKES